MRTLKLILLAVISAVAGVLAWPHLRSWACRPAEAASAPSSSVRTRFELRVRQLHPRARLVVAVLDDDVAVTKFQEHWRGDAKVTVRCPVQVRYSVDLSKLRHDDMTWDATRKILTVTVPDVGIESVELDLAKAQETHELGWARTRARVGEYLASQAKKDLPAAARDLGKRRVILDRARETGMPKVKETFERILRGIVPDAVVEVRTSTPHASP